MHSIKTLGVLSLAGVLMTFAVAAPAFAEATSSNTNAPSAGWRGGMHARVPGVFGTVSAVSGTTITLTGKTPPARSTTGASVTPGATVTYTVDASKATVTKYGATSTVSAIAVGDTVIVQGTVSGTHVTAAVIRDGIPQRGHMGPGGKLAQNSIIQGNGEPVIAGSVSAVNGNTLTVGTRSNISYSVDAAGATVMKDGATSTVSSIATGDHVVVQGTVNGTSVVASSVIDQGALPANTGTGTAAPQHRGFFGALGGFFGGFLHLFGF